MIPPDRSKPFAPRELNAASRRGRHGPDGGSGLVILAREPRPGLVKSRLAAEIGEEMAAALYRAFILDTLDLCVRVAAGARYLAFTPDGAAEAFAAIAGDRFRRIPQGAGDLGERILRSVRRLFDDGIGRAVAVGSDSPTLPPVLVEEALDALERRDVVLGPSLDGGYYLIGIREGDGALFDGIPWGTADVFHATVRRVRERRRALAVLPPWYDVDTAADLKVLRAHIDAMRISGERVAAAKTSALLEIARLPGCAHSDLRGAIPPDLPPRPQT